MTTAILQTEIFSSENVDETREFLIKLCGRRVFMSPLSNSGFSVRIHRFSDWPICLFSGVYEKGFNVDPIVNEDNLTIAFADAGKHCYVHSDGDLGADRSQGMVLNSAHASRYSCSEGAATSFLQIAVSDLNRTLESVLDKPMTRAVNIKAIFPVDGHFGKTLKSIVSIMQNGLADGGVLSNAPNTLRLLREAAVLAVIEGLPHSHTDQMLRNGRLPAPWQIRRSVELIEAADGMVTIQELAEATGTGTRNLQLAFRRYLDSTPIEYMRAVRLAKVRHALLHDDPLLSLDQIAAKYGFYNSGRFSALYRQTYGEKPSETRRRR